MSAAPTQRDRYRFPPAKRDRGKVSPLSIVAFHEAGHAVVAWLAFREMARTPAPLPVTLVEIYEEEPYPDGVPNFTGFCGTPLRDMACGPLEWNNIVMCFAGGIAEARHWGYRDYYNALQFTLERDCTAVDLEAIKHTIAVLRSITGDTDRSDDEAFRHFAGRAWDLLMANWPAVEAIANALMERRRLEGAEIEALMNGVVTQQLTP